MARRATSLGPKLCFCCFCCFCCFLFFFVSFPFFVFNRKTLFFPPKRAFFYFRVSPFVSPEPFWASPFVTFSFSVSLFVCSFFLLLFLFCFLLVPCFCLFLSFFLFLLCFCLMKRTTSNYSITKFFFINRFSFFGVSSPLFSFRSLFPYLCFFPDFKFCFLLNVNVFFWKCKLKKHQFLVKRGVAT